MKNKIFSYILLSGMALLSLNLSTKAQNVIIADDDSFSAHSSAMLHVKSLNKGLLIPQLTEAQRNAIVSPADGLLIYQTNNNPGIYIYQSGWKLLGSDLGTHTATENLMLNDNWLSNDGDDEGIIITDDGKVGIDTTSPQVKLHVVSEDNDIAIFESRSSHSIIHIKSKDSSKVAALYGSLGNDAVGALDFRPLTGDLTLWTNDLGGSSWHQRMMIKNSSGYVGIGTDAPTSQLTIQTSGSGYNGFSGLHIKELTDRGTLTLESVTNDPTDFVMKNNNRYNWSISSRNSLSNYSLNFYASADGSSSFSTLAMSMATDGKIGIGISDPAYTLDVNGEVTSRSYNAFRLRQSNYSAILRNDKNAFYLLLTNNGDPDGTWNSLRPFSVNLATGNISLANSVSITHGGDININDNTIYVRATSDNAYGMGYDVEGGQQLTIFSDHIIDFTESDQEINVMRIDANAAKVGIGTTSPTAKLSVQATASTGDTLFAVKDLDGNNVFVVYPDAVQVIVPTDTKGGKSNKKGAFLVSGRGSNKAESNFMNMTKENYLIGHNVGINITGTQNSILGYEAGRDLSSGVYNTMVGYQAGLENTTASSNVFIGYRAGFNNTTNGGQIFIGREAGWNNSYGDNNIYIGYQSGHSNTSGLNNICIGYNSMLGGDGSYNTFLGYETGYTSGVSSYNTLIGYMSGRGISYGNDNTCVGRASGGSLGNGKNNVLLGNYAGYEVSGDYNTHIGNYAGYGNENGNYNVFIGNFAGYYETGSNKLYIDVSNTSSPLIWGDFSANTVNINGEFAVNNSNPSYTFDLVSTTPGNSSSASYAGRIYHQYNSNYARGLIIRTGNSSGSTSGSVYFIRCSDYDGSYVGNIYSSNGSLQIAAKGPSKSRDITRKSTKKALNIINNLEVVDYKFDTNNEYFQTGFIAKDAINIVPEIVNFDEVENEYSIAYSALVPILTKALQEQHAKIEAKDIEIENLKARLEVVEQFIQNQNK